MQRCVSMQRLSLCWCKFPWVRSAPSFSTGDAHSNLQRNLIADASASSMWLMISLRFETDCILLIINLNDPSACISSAPLIPASSERQQGLPGSSTTMVRGSSGCCMKLCGLVLESYRLFRFTARCTRDGVTHILFQVFLLGAFGRDYLFPQVFDTD